VQKLASGYAKLKPKRLPTSYVERIGGSGTGKADRNIAKTQCFEEGDDDNRAEHSVSSQMVGYFFNRLKYRDLEFLATGLQSTAD
jgi:hypothetical protein